MRYAVFSSLQMIDGDLLRSFEGLAEDRYLKSEHCFRFRAFGSARVKGNAVLWEEDLVFRQGRDINSYAGGVDRRFPPIGESARSFAEEFVRSRRIHDLLAVEEFELGCHQIRIVAEGENPGFPAPEGFHRDGFELITVTCVATDNVSGGESLVDVGGELIFTRAIAPGETLLLDDRAVTHYVSPIMPRTPGRATRDVIVMTFTRNER
ncbi:2OG-Fe dioxygenase family protein [Actinocorallia sp. B10E7]|uniref:2OG-Fe dioxygenase family protein n=1 Tax=Actinocorallia sp. B10E7 TaxID=3153558 RepID=UPI00325D37F9